MVMDPNINLFSFEILKNLPTSPYLFYTMQSLSLAHQNFFLALRDVRRYSKKGLMRYL
jgi:hypothetical protein